MSKNNTQAIIDSLRALQSAGDTVVNLTQQLGAMAEQAPGDMLAALTVVIDSDDGGDPARKRALLDAFVDAEGKNLRLSIQVSQTKTGKVRKVNGTVLAANDRFTLFRKPEKADNEQDAFIQLMERAAKLADAGDQRAVRLLEAYKAILEEEAILEEDATS